MRMFITSKNKFLSNDMKIFGTCSIPLRFINPFSLNLISYWPMKSYLVVPIFLSASWALYKKLMQSPVPHPNPIAIKPDHLSSTNITPLPLGAIHNCQSLIECTKHTLSQTASPSKSVHHSIFQMNNLPWKKKNWVKMLKVYRINVFFTLSVLYTQWNIDNYGWPLNAF